MSGTIKALLVEDDYFVRETVTDYLAKRGVQVGGAGSVEEAMAEAEDLQPDVAIVDLILPERSGERAQFDRPLGVDVARQLRQRFPTLGIVFLSAFPDKATEVNQLFADSRGRMVYLLKGSPPTELWQAIEKVMESQRPMFEMDEGIQPLRKTAYELALETLTKEERPVIEAALEQVKDLSDAERLVFEAAGSCRSQRLAAAELICGSKTVGYHKDAIYGKLGLQGQNKTLNLTALLAKVYLLYRLQQAEKRAQVQFQRGIP